MDAPNIVWAINFQCDSTTDGRPIKILSAVDEHTRECLERASRSVFAIQPAAAAGCRRASTSVPSRNSNCSAMLKAACAALAAPPWPPSIRS